MDLGIEGRTALVMAASRGIGTGHRRRAGARGRAGGDLEPLGGGAAGSGGGDRRRGADVPGGHRAIWTGCASCPAEVAEALGPVEILVTNTGGPPGGGALDNSLEEWEAAYRSLVLAPRVLIEAVLPGMRERGWGRIVNVSSTSIREPIPGLALSNAHRMAALGLLKTLADEVAGDGITVNTVATGLFATDRLADRHGSLEQAEAARARAGSGRPARARRRSTATWSPSCARSGPPISPER